MLAGVRACLMTWSINAVSDWRNLFQTRSESAAERKVLETRESRHASIGVVWESMEAMQPYVNTSNSAITQLGLPPPGFARVLYNSKLPIYFKCVTHYTIEGIISCCSFNLKLVFLYYNHKVMVIEFRCFWS